MQDRGSEFGATPTNLATTTKALLTAAEPFEALTETAFTASKSQRSKAIEADADAVRSVQGIVPQSVLIVLKRNMAAISAADVADHHETTWPRNETERVRTNELHRAKLRHVVVVRGDVAVKPGRRVLRPRHPPPTPRSRSSAS